MELAARDAILKRRLKLELAGLQSPEQAAREISKRLGQLARARGFVDWRKTRALAADLETQRSAILKIGETNAHEALALMWQFLGLADATFDRCDDSSGQVGDVFRAACTDLGPLAAAANADPISLADRAFVALMNNGYGQFDGLITTLAPALGSGGRTHLKNQLLALQQTPEPRPPDKERRTVGWSMSGPIYADEIESRARNSAIRLALQDIADVKGDVDAFLAQYSAADRRKPGIAAQLAPRLVAAGRAEQASRLVAEVEDDGRDWLDLNFENARIEVLEAVGEPGAAQAARWSVFERALSVDHLRAFIAKLPDFEDQDALERAFAYADAFPDTLRALAFYIAWPALDRAEALVRARPADLDGNDYEILSPAAEMLAARQPLAATLLLRAMIDFTLSNARSSRYRHAARHLMDCAGLARSIADFSPFETHEAYVARLKGEHGRKSGFWSAVDAA